MPPGLHSAVVARPYRGMVPSGNVLATLVHLVGTILGCLPLRLQLLLGDFLGLTAWLVLRRRRLVARHNIATAFPDLAPAELDLLVRDHFRHLGRSMVEMFSLPALRSEGRRKRKITFIGFEKIDAVLASGRGAMVLTAHMGNWEIMTTIAAMGYDFSALFKPQRNIADDIMTTLRTACGLKVFSRHEGLRGVIRAAREAKMVGILADQGGDDRFPFFGRPAVFPTGASVFAVRHGLAPFPIFGIRQPDGRVEIRVGDPVEPRTDLPPEEAKADFQARYIEVLEAAIRENPEQYFWVHDIWHDFKRRKPDS